MQDYPSASARLTAAIVLSLLAARADGAHDQIVTCDPAGIGSVALTADGPVPQVAEVSTGKQGDVGYCLVKVRVPEAINIWVGLPMDGAWNGRWQSVGGGVYAGAVSVPGEAIAAGYAAAATDTGHAGGRPGVPVPFLDGSFGMLKPGEPNEALQRDFAYRSEHLMAVIGKQLVQAFYGTAPRYSYWNGCSTGGRQGLRMAQDFPEDYDGILAGAPAIHWDRFQAAMLWYPVIAQHYNGGPVGGGKQPVLTAKLRLATQRAVSACDALDGVTDGVLDDPRRCGYETAADTAITRASCTAEATDCLTPAEAKVVDSSWMGPVACPGGGQDCKVPAVASRDLRGKKPTRMWYGQPRGTDLSALGGAGPFPVAIEQPRYWVYFDADWNWQQLDPDKFLAFFRDSVERVGPMMASDNPDLRGFRKRGGKLVIWHGSRRCPLRRRQWTPAPEALRRRGGLGREGRGTRHDSRFQAGRWPERTRPLCPWPGEALWNGKGSSDQAENFSCVGRR